jgi:alkylhydroperoxidase family enzyme
MSANIPRLAYEDLAPALQDLFRARVERLGYLGEFFKVMSHAPETMAGFNTITESLKQVLPDKFTEIVSLGLSSRLGNLYEQYQNERLSRRLGFSDDWIREALEPVAGPDSVFSSDEKAVQAFAIAVMENKGQGVEAELVAVIRAIGPEQTVGVMWLVGRTVTHAMISNTLKLEPPVASLFEDET